jgi:hypothetical protein
VDNVKLSVDPASLRALLGKSSQFEPKQKAALRRRLREAGQEAREAVQEAARAPGQTQAARPTRTGLRERLAAGTRVSVLSGSRAGVQVVTRAKLSQAWEARRGWRHPVYGGRAKWVTQVGHPGYFSNTIWARRNATRRAVEQAMRDALKSMGGPS